jgi:hypothetical protein
MKREKECPMNGRTAIGILALILRLATVPAPAGPLQKSEVNPTANWVVHADLEAFRASGIGKLVMAELAAQGIDEKLQAFANIASFDPLKDVRDVTLYGEGKDRCHAVVLIDGRFDPEKVLAVVRWNPEHQEIPYNGVTIHQWPNEENKGGQTTRQIMYGYLHGRRQIVISSGLDALKQAVDTLKGPAPGTPSGLLSQIPESPSGAFLQATAVRVGEMIGQEPKAALFKQSGLLVLAAGQAADNIFAELRLRNESPEVADNVTKMLQGIVAMTQLAGQEQPKLSELAKGVSVSRMDKTAQVRFEAPAQAVFAFVKEQWEQKKQQPQQQATP